jgi:hypothetical protein
MLELFIVFSTVLLSYQCAKDGIQKNGSKLVEERPRRHEVSSVDDDRRKYEQEERMRIELMIVSGVGIVQNDAQNDTDYYE